MEKTAGGEVALAILAEELADQYKRMSRSHRDLHRRAILRVAAEILEVVASELISDTVSRSTIERLETITSLLRRNYLPYRRLERLTRLVKELGYPGSYELRGFGVPQFDKLNTTLS